MIQNLDNYEPALGRTGLIIGPFKTGKTRSLATAVARGYFPVDYFNFDGGDAPDPFIRNVRKLYPEIKSDDIRIHSYIPKGGDKVSSTVYRPHGQGEGIFLTFLSEWNKLQDAVNSQTGQWKTGLDFIPPKMVVLDSSTKLQEIIMDFVLAQSGHELMAKGTDSRVQYNQQKEKTVEIITSMKSLPCLSIVLAHTIVKQDELTSEVTDVPDFTGKLAGSIGKEFGFVLWTKTKKNGENTDFLWQTRPTGRIVGAGTRSMDDLPLLIPQDFAQILPKG